MHGSLDQGGKLNRKMLLKHFDLKTNFFFWTIFAGTQHELAIFLWGKFLNRSVLKIVDMLLEIRLNTLKHHLSSFLVLTEFHPVWELL